MTTSLSSPDEMYGASVVVSNDASLDVERRVPRTVHPLRRKVWATWAASWSENERKREEGESFKRYKGWMTTVCDEGCRSDELGAGVVMDESRTHEAGDAGDEDSGHIELDSRGRSLGVR